MGSSIANCSFSLSGGTARSAEDGLQKVPAGSGRFRQDPAGSARIRQFPTGSNRFQKVPRCSS
eukprot:11044157-Alexandrium_andersonii.AAC.1